MITVSFTASRLPPLPPLTWFRVPRVVRDVSELRTWVMDIRHVLVDNAIRDMLAESDAQDLAALRAASP